MLSVPALGLYTFLRALLVHLSRRLVGELMYAHGPASVRRPSSSTISNMNISATSEAIATKFYLKHHLVGGKAALGFGLDRIRTLATESSHRVILNGENCLHLFSAFFHPILFILAGNDDMHYSSDEFEFRPDWTTDCEVSCP